MTLDNRKKVLAVLVVVTLIAIPAIAILALDQPDNDNGIIEEDALGRQVTVESFSMIVSCTPEITEMVYAMGKGTNLVGVTSFCDYPQDVLDRKGTGNLTDIGGYWDPSLEAIVDLEPTLVLVSAGVVAQTELVPQMESLNITVVGLYPGRNMTEVTDNLRLMGIIFRDSGKAEELTSNMTGLFEDIQGVISMHAVKPKVLFALWLDPLYTTGGATFVDEIINMSGGQNVFHDVEGWPMPSMEQVIEAAPEYLIITGTMMMQTPEEIIQMLENDSFWSVIPAVQNDHVYIVLNQAENTFVRPGVRMTDAVHLLAEILYPADFNAEVPHVIGSEYHEYLEDVPNIPANT